MFGAVTLLAGAMSLPQTPSTFAGQTATAGEVGSHHRRRMSSSSASASSASASAAGAGRKFSSGSLYQVLRVKQDALPVEIKTAYRSLAKLYHPDANESESGSDGRDFIEIHNAYATLSDPSARQLYDLSLGNRRGGGRRRTSSPPPYSAGFYPSRRWETDQCW